MKFNYLDENNNPTKPQIVQRTLVLTLVGFAMFAVAAWPNDQWSPAWGNFFGAGFVAVGGLLASLHAYEVVPHETKPASWAFIVVGGFIIAGASLRFALMPA